ncbi:hypothetical protein ACFQYP_02260 [Nonomuraea antimicrobica]
MSAPKPLTTSTRCGWSPRSARRRRIPTPCWATYRVRALRSTVRPATVGASHGDQAAPLLSVNQVGRSTVLITW